MEFSKTCRLWLESKKSSVKESTFYLYKYCVEKYILKFFDGKKNSDFTKKSITKIFSDFVIKCEKIPLQSSTTRNLTVILKQIVIFGMDKKLIKEFRLDFLIIKQKKESCIPKTYSISEQKEIMTRLLEICAINKKALGIMLSLSLGLRIGEVCALKWKNIDFLNSTVQIDGTVQRILTGENEKTKVVVGSPKSFSSRRTIPLPAEIEKIIEKCKISSINNFILSDSETPVEPRCLRQFFKNFCRKNGFRELKFHSLRHTFATRCIENNVDCKTVSEILGHSNVKTTMNLYVHPSMELKRKCVNITKFFEE